MSLAELLSLKVKLADKTEETITESSSSITLFTQRDIERLGVNSLFDLLQHVPGFYSMMNSAEGNQSHLVMRGHAQKYANTLLILLNGQRINEDYTGGINYLIRHFNLHLAEKVEVIRGPGSSLYGSNAYSGVVNIITNYTSKLKVSGGSIGHRAVSTSFTNEFENWTLGGGISTYRDSGFDYEDIFDRNGVQSETNDPRKVFQLDFRLNDENTTFNLNHLESERQNYYLFRRVSDGNTEVELSNTLFSAEHKHALSEQLNILYSASYQFAERKSVTALSPQGEPPFLDADFLFGEDFEYESFGAAIDFVYHPSSTVDLSFGLSYQSSQVPDAYLRSNYDIFGDLSYLAALQTFEDDDFRVVLDHKRNISSLYLQSKWKISDQLTLTSGLRFDDYNDVKSALTPRLSLIYQKDQHTFKLIYGEAYRAPSLGDLYDEESGLTVGNRNLLASELKSLELSHSLWIDEVLITTVLFDNEHTNLIGFRADESGNVFLDNVAENEAQGIELDFKWRPNKNWSFEGSITHLFKNETELGASMGLPASEMISPNTYLSYLLSYMNEEWRFNLIGVARDKVETLANHSNLSIYDINLSYQLNQRSQLKLAIKNLLDEAYSTSSYIELGTTQFGEIVQEYPARGRVWQLEYTYLFD